MKDQNWFAVFLDFFIVIAGILIAFQINNWNEAQSDKKTAREYIARIQEDLLANQASMKVRVEYFEAIIDHGVRTLSALDHPPEDLGAIFLIDAYQASTGVWLTAPIGRDAYDELLSVGAINIIPDVRIRQHLARYYQTNEAYNSIIQNVPSYVDALRGAMPYNVQLEIRTQCSPIIDRADTGPRGISLPKNCVLEFPKEQVLVSVAAVHKADLKKHLALAMSDAHDKLRFFNGILRYSQQLYDILEASK